MEPPPPEVKLAGSARLQQRLDLGLGLRGRAVLIWGGLRLTPKLENTRRASMIVGVLIALSGVFTWRRATQVSVNLFDVLSIGSLFGLGGYYFLN